MKILIINTQNKNVAKDMLIRAAIKTGKQCVEMEEEVLIEDYLVKFKEKESTLISSDLFLFDRKLPEPQFKNIEPVLEPTIPKQKRLYYKKQSKFVNDKLKMNQNYNSRRRYQ